MSPQPFSMRGALCVKPPHDDATAIHCRSRSNCWRQTNTAFNAVRHHHHILVLRSPLSISRLVSSRCVFVVVVYVCVVVVFACVFAHRFVLRRVGTQKKQASTHEETRPLRVPRDCGLTNRLSSSLCSWSLHKTCSARRVLHWLRHTSNCRYIDNDVQGASRVWW